MKEGRRVVVLSFDEQEDGSITLTVGVSGQFNALIFERSVFGIKPDELEPCEIPGPDEVTGALIV
jgi:hypothetical protein